MATIIIITTWITSIISINSHVPLSTNHAHKNFNILCSIGLTHYGAILSIINFECFYVSLYFNRIKFLPTNTINYFFTFTGGHICTWFLYIIKGGILSSYHLFKTVEPEITFNHNHIYCDLKPIKQLKCLSFQFGLWWI